MLLYIGEIQCALMYSPFQQAAMPAYVIRPLVSSALAADVSSLSKAARVMSEVMSAC